PEHGPGRIYAKAAVGHGRLVSTSEPRGKRGDYQVGDISLSGSIRQSSIVLILALHHQPPHHSAFIRSANLIHTISD
ncbi:hypothetical protein, partial [Burkholderia stagnalis]|uniref:hypothetical protein n=1 Tax=Burkholderia stagnalis TaxID=1503054 RepID=UPI001E4C2BED